MIKIRKSEERGHVEHGWLDSYHTFSFASYFDRNHMNFRSLRVINEDRISGGMGFDEHPHRDMEIITYVVNGALEHKDSMGNTSVIHPGEVQRMSAGTGVLHSEFNKLKDAETHLFQIWILPRQKGTKPGYGQKSFQDELSQKKLVLVVSSDGREGSIAIDQDVNMYISRLESRKQIDFDISDGRGVWVQVVRGSLSINDNEVVSGDAVSLEGEEKLKVLAHSDAEILVFDLGA